MFKSLSGILFFLILVCPDDAVTQQNANHEFILGPRLPDQSLDDVIAQIDSTYQYDIDKIKAVYSWMVQNLEYDYELPKRSSTRVNNDPFWVFQSRKGICIQFVSLFNHFMDELGVSSFEVVGYCKECETEDDQLLRPTHAWNAVLLDAEWYMLDVTWDISLSRDVDGFWVSQSDQYLLVEPSKFLKDHLPAVPMWQLSDSIVTIEDYRLFDYDKASKVKYKGDFKNELNKYLKMSLFERRLFEESEAYRYNESKQNAESYAHRLVDQAAILSDSLDYINQSINQEKYITIVKKIISLCAAADKLTTFHTWQNEMYAGTIINYIVWHYNQNDKTYWALADWEALQNEVRRAKYILQRFEDSYYKSSSLEICNNITAAINEYLKKYE